jgi:hypothetical protein
MNKKLHRNLPSVFISLVWAGVLFVPSAVNAQTYWLHYGMVVGSTDSGTQNNSYDSGKVQSTNLLTANLAGPGSIASVSATPSASYGLLQLAANCAVDNPGSDGNGHLSRFQPDVGTGPDVDFQDELTLTSAALPAGTPVQIQFVCVASGYITPGSGVAFHETASSAYVKLYDAYANVQPVTTTIGGNYETNTISLTQTNRSVGYTFTFGVWINANGEADDSDGKAFSGSVSTEITVKTYVNVLTPGASYTSASGTVYPALQLPPPILNIHATNDSVVISWPSAYADYGLQQNSNLAGGVWTASGYSISTANGTNSITISPPTGNLFFRLQQNP